MALDSFQKWTKTLSGSIIVLLLKVVATYVFVSLAIDRGSPIVYLLAVLGFIGVIRTTTLVLHSRGGSHVR